MDKSYYIEYVNLSTFQIETLGNLTLDEANELYEKYLPTTHTIWIAKDVGEGVSYQQVIRSRVISAQQFKQETLKKYIKKL